MKSQRVTTGGGFFRKVAAFAFIAARIPILCLALASGATLQTQAASAHCPVPSIKEHATVEEVVDGDTLRLANHRLVRLVGVNAPEIHYDGSPSEPWARAAKDFLMKLLHNHKTIGLEYETDTQDRYGRQLAHVFFNDHDSPVDVQQKILENGLGYWIVIPPNTEYLNCYQAAESRARQRHLGLWSGAFATPKNAAEKNTLTPGFQRLQGTVVDVHRTKKSVWLKFNDQVVLRIATKDIHNFNMTAVYALKGQTLIARGWLYKHDQELIMPVRLPAALELQH